MRKHTNSRELASAAEHFLIVTLQKEVLSGSFLFDIFDGPGFVDARPEIVRITTERNAQQFQESIHASQ